MSLIKCLIGLLYCSIRLSPERAAEQTALEAKGLCKFCDAGFDAGITKELERGRFWRVVETPHPYEGTVAHWVVVYHRHITRDDEMEPGAAEELFELFRKFKKKFTIRGCAMFMRSGEMLLTCSSIAHLHVHFIAGRQDIDPEQLDITRTLRLDYGYPRVE